MIVDTTCMEANVTFPTDTKLLKKTWQRLVEVAEKIREDGQDIVIRGKQRLLKEIRGFDLQRKKGRKLIQKMRKKIWRETVKLEKKIRKALEEKAVKAEKSLEEMMGSLEKKTKVAIETAQKIIAQQGEMIRENTHSVKDRIVSFHEPTVRPIVRERGKECGVRKQNRDRRVPRSKPQSLIKQLLRYGNRQRHPQKVRRHPGKASHGNGRRPRVPQSGKP